MACSSASFSGSMPAPEDVGEVVNGEQRVDSFLPFIFQRAVGRTCVGEAGVAADVGDRRAPQNRAHRWLGSPRDIAVPARRHKPLARIATRFEHDDLWMPVDVLGEGMNFELTEQTPEGDVFFDAYGLIAKHQHLVIEPRLAQFLERVLIDGRQVDTGYLSPDLRGDRPNFDSHGSSLETSDHRCRNLAGNSLEIVGEVDVEADDVVVPSERRDRATRSTGERLSTSAGVDDHHR